MSIADIVQKTPQGAAIVAVLFTVIQITPLKLNPWSWLFKQMGHAMNGEFKNERTVQSIKIIRETYHDCVRTNDFL